MATLKDGRVSLYDKPRDCFRVIKGKFKYSCLEFGEYYYICVLQEVQFAAYAVNL